MLPSVIGGPGDGNAENLMSPNGAGIIHILRELRQDISV